MVEKIGTYKKATEPTSFGRFEAELVNKVSLYCTISGINRIDFITNLIERELEGKLLTNDFIELEKPLYFYRNGTLVNLLDLRKFKEEILYIISPDKPDKLKKYFYTYVIKKVPNNLDVFNKEYGKYCYNNKPYLHKGIYLYKDIIIKDNKLIYYPSFLLFEYNEYTVKLTVKEISFKEIPFHISNNEEYKEIYKTFEDEFFSTTDSNNTSDNLILNEYIPSREVIDNLAVKECSEKFDIIKIDKINSVDVNSIAHKNKCITAEDIEVYFQL